MAPADRAEVALCVRGVRVPGGRADLARRLEALGTLIASRAKRPVVLTFVVLGDEEMRAVNRRSLGHDHATDVLSFPLAEAPVLEADVLLSADTARREAAARGHPAADELMLYAVHGCLHLLGHDDHDPAARRRMRAAERRLLARLGLPPLFGRG